MSDSFFYFYGIVKFNKLQINDDSFQILFLILLICILQPIAFAYNIYKQTNRLSQC